MIVDNKDKLKDLLYVNPETGTYQISVLKFDEEGIIFPKRETIKDSENVELCVTTAPKKESIGSIEIITPLSSIRLDKYEDEFIFVLSNTLDPNFYSEELEKNYYVISSGLLCVMDLRDFYFDVIEGFPEIEFSIMIEVISDEGIVFNSLFPVTAIGTSGSDRFPIVQISSNMNDFISELKNK